MPDQSTETTQTGDQELLSPGQLSPRSSGHATPRSPDPSAPTPFFEYRDERAHLNVRTDFWLVLKLVAKPVLSGFVVVES